MRTSLTAHSQAFQHVLNAETPTLQATQVNHRIRKLTPLVDTVISLQTMENDIFSAKFAELVNCIF